MLNDLLAKNQSSDKLYVEDVFSTWLYTGNGSTQTITNGIDLSGKGGMVWLKARSFGHSNALYDTIRGGRQALSTNLTAAQYTAGAGQELYTFGSSGFTLGTDANFSVNTNGVTFASWTFRKAPKFFDVVTWSGNSTNRTISHNLGTVPGMIVVKRTDSAADWQVYHCSLANTEYAVLNTTAAKATGTTRWNSTTATDTVFSLGTDSTVNATGGTYVAYIFAHDTTADGVIQCGSFTTDGSGNATVNLGWEPQFVLYKSSSNTSNWSLLDNMRGMVDGGAGSSSSDDAELMANLSNAETLQGRINPTATGFFAPVGFGSRTYIYLAIRRGPMRVPTDATKVFVPSTSAYDVATTTNFPVDGFLGGFSATNSGQVNLFSRLTGGYALVTSSTSAQINFDYSNNLTFANNTSFKQTVDGSMNRNWLFRRAPGFFDVVCYTTTNSTNQRITHNLGVAPEMIITKNRGSAGGWFTYVAALGRSKYLSLNGTAASNGFGNDWGTSDPTSTDFGYNTQIFQSSPYSGNTVVAYLFASCPGVSKVGSYTGTGTTKQIDCGFTNGARFVLIKRTDSTGDWYLYDSARGIVAGNDPYLLLNSTAAEVTNTDYVDAYSAGFELSSTSPAALNANGGTYIYLAIA